MKQLLLYGCFCLLAFATQAQTGSSVTDTATIAAKLKKATQYLRGGLYPYDPAKAFQLNMECAQAGSPQGMNAIAIQYRNGLGVDSNNTQSLQWFYKAAQAGYSKAWYNLGIYYKNTTPTDFKQSFDCFVKASAAGDPAGDYGQGYMLYKGFGCKQNYKKAVALFRKGAYEGYAASMHYYGLALRNGYGAAASTDSARYWLAKAASLGYNYSFDELAAKEPEIAGETTDIPQRLQAARRNLQPGTGNDLRAYSDVSHVPATLHNIPGIWEGYIVKYDWSGQHVISTSRLVLQLSCTDSLLTGIWLEDDSLQVAVNGRLTKKGVEFNNMQYKRSSHYTKEARLTNFDETRLRLVQKGDTVYLAGNLRQSVAHTKEPERPLYVALTRAEPKTAAPAIAKTQSLQQLPAGMTVQVYPNPTAGDLYVQLTLPQPTSIQLQVTNAQGQAVYTGQQQALPAGVHRLPVQVAGANGAYVLTLRYGQAVTSTIIMKQ